MADRITKIASTVGRAYGSFIKARDEMLRKPQFVADYIQQTAWQGGMFDNTDQATMRAIRNSWVYSDIQMKALDLAMSKINIYNNPAGLDGEGEQAPGHDFLKVLRRPNPYMGSGLMWQYTHWWMDLRGKAFWFLAPGVNREIAEIWPIPANRMAMEPTDDNKGIKRWILKLSRWWYLDPKYVCYFRYANPFDFFDGLPPLVAAMLTVDADLAMKTWNGAFFGQDNVMPSAVISLGSGDANRLIDPQDIQAVKEELKSEYQAINRKTIVTNANNMSAALLGWNAKDMDFLNGMAWNRDEIDWCFGVPPGMHDKNSTEANAKVGKGIFKDNMWGLKNLYADEITNQIMKPHYHEDLEVRFEDDRIVDRELQLKEAALAKEAMSREEWAQKYFNVELQPGDVTMAEGARQAEMEQKQQQFGDVKDGKKFDEKSKKPGSGVTMKGGQGSGNFDHAGRPGLVGGSAPEGTINQPVSRWRKQNSILKKWKRSEYGILLSDDDIRLFEGTGLAEKTDTFRGLRLYTSSDRYDDLKNLQPGDVIEWSDDLADSWTTSRGKAEMFMVSNGSIPTLADIGLQRYGQDIGLGLVLKVEMLPDDTVVDIGRWMDSAEDAVPGITDSWPMFGSEGEIITKPRAKFKATVVTRLTPQSLNRFDDFTLNRKSVSVSVNEYHPWETEGITEAEYFKRAYLEERKPKKSIADELDLFHRKAVNKFKEKSHCNNLKFVSDVLDEETVKAIQSDLEGVEQRSDIEEIFAHWKGEVE